MPLNIVLKTHSALPVSRTPPDTHIRRTAADACPFIRSTDAQTSARRLHEIGHGGQENGRFRTQPSDPLVV